jgi:hypothetical protein
VRNISFALTTEQVRNRTKTVTRRLGWKNLKPGTFLQPVVKAQGLKKGEHVEKIGGPIRVVKVGTENLLTMIANVEYGEQECVREGFADLSPVDFAAMFCEHNACSVEDDVTRIEFEYVKESE